MTELFIVLSLYFALAWVIVRTVLIFVHIDEPDEIPLHHIDPIVTYIDENYGSHFVEDPVTVNRSMRRR